jgi:hypothetical protein
MSAVGVFRIAPTARIKGAGSAELRARIRVIEEPMFNQYRRQFLALDKFAENEGRIAISYLDLFAEVDPVG